MSREDSYDDYPGGILEKYVINVFVDYVLFPMIDKISLVKETFSKGLVKKL